MAASSKPAVTPPPPLARALAEAPAARAKWSALPASHQREYAQWIASAKKDETRDRRVVQAIAMLTEGRKTPMRANDAPAVSAAPVTKKLGVKEGWRLVVLGAPKGHAVAAHAAAGKGKGNVVVGFVKDRGGVAATWPKARAALADGGVLWLAYPKKTSGIATDLTRDHGWEPLRDDGWQSVAVVSIDDEWSAVRFRPEQGA